MSVVFLRTARNIRPTIPRKNRPMRTLEIGPAMAILNSSQAVGGSSSICATPPKMNSVMLLMGMPLRRATSACDNSCAITAASSAS